jgi:hypothetical protein
MVRKTVSNKYKIKKREWERKKRGATKTTRVESTVVPTIQYPRQTNKNASVTMSPSLIYTPEFDVDRAVDTLCVTGSFRSLATHYLRNVRRNSWDVDEGDLVDRPSDHSISYTAKIHILLQQSVKSIARFLGSKSVLPMTIIVDARPVPDIPS